jgi:hypothetical protein
MQLTINTKYTLNPQTVALNFDSEFSEYFKEELIANLKKEFKQANFNNGCLIIEPLDAEDVTKKHIETIEKEAKQILTNYQEMFKKIKESTGLTLDSDSLYDDPDFQWD